MEQELQLLVYYGNKNSKIVLISYTIHVFLDSIDMKYNFEF